MNEPELFALDWTPPAHTATQPVQHPCGLLQIQRSAQPQMVLTFEADRAMDLDVPELGLILRAEPDRHRSF